VYQKTTADLKGRIEKAEENIALKAETAEWEGRFAVITEAAGSVVDLILSQTAMYNSLNCKIEFVHEVIGNARKILARAPK
jgi:hypothetical protein